jgi:hypothetical protein
MGFLEGLYNQLLSYFPDWSHPFVSVGLIIFIVYSTFQAFRHHIIFWIVLALAIPAAVPIIKHILDTKVEIIKFLLGSL